MDVNQATALVGMGYSIFPITEDTKIPAVKWSIQSTRDMPEVRDWWETFPRDNVGINCGESGIFVVDLDNPSAAQIFWALWNEQEAEQPKVAVTTPRGMHLYFDATPAKTTPGPAVASARRKPLGNSASKLGPGIDTRGVGGMVLAPGCVVKGRPYTLLRGTLSDLPPLPLWLYRRLSPKPQTLAEERKKARQQWLKPSPFQAERELRRWCAKIVAAPDGTQNDTINMAARYLTKDYCPPLDPEEIRHELERAAREGHHPSYRARPTISSGLAAGLSDAGGTAGRRAGGDQGAGHLGEGAAEARRFRDAHQLGPSPASLGSRQSLRREGRGRDQPGMEQ